MKKIITAINNPKLNEELKKENKFEIIGKDIQYKEAILEILEKNNDIDLIIINEKIPGEIKLEKLIKNIKVINENIKIIFILEKENNELEKILIKNKVIDIYYNYKINLKELIEIINKKEINMEEEIIKLKKIIEEKNMKSNSMKNNFFIKNKKEKKILKSKIIKVKENLLNINKNKKQYKKTNYNLVNRTGKIITFSGNYKSGKTTLSLITSQYLLDKNYKVLLIDGDLEKEDLSIILKKEKRKKYKSLKNNQKNKQNSNKKEKILIRIKNYKYKRLINKKNKIYSYKIKSIINLFIIKVNKQLYFFNGLKYLLDNKKINLLFFEKIIKTFDFVIIDLSKNNDNIINKQILEISTINFILMEANLLGIKEIKKLISKYIDEWKINKESIQIIINKKNIICANRVLISKSLEIKNKFFEIKENKIYYLLINNYYKRKILLKNKRVKREIKKVINWLLKKTY